MAAGPYRVIWSVRAKHHLDAILEFVATTSPRGAELIAARVLEAADSLAEFPERGRPVPELRSTRARELFVFSYRLMYIVDGDCVQIVALLHGARDID